MRRFRVLVAVALALAPAAPALAQPADWGVQRNPFDKTVVARYKAILAKLLAMYRRYKTVDLLRSEYEKALEKKPDDWSALVVLGRLHRAIGDEPRARVFLGKAVAVKDSDAQSWILIGELDKSAGKNQ